jgi:hypothetical protein
MIKKLLHVFLMILGITTVAKAQVQTVAEDKRGMSARIAHEVSITMDPALGYVPKSRLVEAYGQKRADHSRIAVPNSLANLVWTERGPNSDAVGPSNGNSRPGNGKTSGRIRAIWEDLGDATGKTVWVGGIDGGLWKTTDITATPATWTPINDFFGNLAVSGICQDPSNTSIIYFGTGEKAFNADAVRGAGIWQSTDGGATWAIMPGTQTYWNVSKLACDASGNLYVGTNSSAANAGLLRYTKSTATWTNITPSGLSTRIADMEMSSTGRLHVSCGYYNTAAASAGYRYTANPETVTSNTWTSPVTSYTPVQYNVDLASAGNTIYALPSSSAWQVTTIYKSTDGGANWTATGTTPSFTSGQAWYCMAAAVDPNNANNVIVGSLDCYKTTNGGSTWTKISEWVGTTGQYVHADQQTISWRNNNQVLIGCDGGIHYSANGGTTIVDKNTGLRIKQFYAIANHPTSLNYFLAGAQDNGVHQLNSAGLGASVEVTGGDGAFVHIDQDQPQYQWGAYVYNQYRRSTNSGGNWSSINYSSSAGRFINPTDYDDANNRMYCSGNANTFVRWDNPQSGSTFVAVTMNELNTATVSAVKVSPFTSNTVYFGGGKSGVLPVLIKAANANTATPTYTNIIAASMQVAGANISSIEFGANENTIIASFSNYGVNNVWITYNGGGTWTSVDGNLPDMPVRWAIFYPGDDTKAIIATETGVWETDQLNGASTVWTANPTFPNVRTDMLQYRSADGMISAATHGRGIFSTLLSTAVSCGNPTGLSSNNITVNSATLSWSAVTNATGYDVEYKENASSIWINAATATTATSVDLTGLTPSTLYDWHVIAHCSAGDGSYVSAAFTTAMPFVCNTPSGLTSSSVTAGSATISWTAVNGATQYDVDYKENASSTWINAATGTTAVSVDLSGLNASTLYDWRVNTHCADTTTDYSLSQFTTIAPFVCNAPGGLTSSAITAGAATVSWTAVSGAVSYDVDYKDNASGTWTNAVSGTTSLSANLSGLNASTLYDWRVRTNCSGSSSGYSAAQFTTTAAGCPDILEPNNTLATAAPISTGLNYNALIAANGDNDYYSFSNTTALKKIKVTLTNLPADYDLRMYKPNGTLQSTSSNSGTANETIILNATKNNEVGTYKVYVYGFSGAFNSTQCYTLNVQIGSTNFTSAELGGIANADVKTLRTGLKLYPVPATTSVTVSFDAYAKGEAIISIVNQNGQLMQRQKVGVDNGINFRSLDLSKLEAGVYTLQIKTGTTVYSEKLVVSK